MSEAPPLMATRDSWLPELSEVVRRLRHFVMVITPGLYLVAIVTAYRWYFLALAALLVLSVSCEWERSTNWLGMRSLLSALALFWLSLAVSAVWALDPGLTLGALWLPAVYIGLFVSVARWSREQSLVRQTDPFVFLVWVVAGVYLWVYLRFGAIRPVTEEVKAAFGSGSNIGAMHVLVAMPLLVWRLRVAPTPGIVLTCLAGLGVLLVSGTRSAFLVAPILGLTLAMLWASDRRKYGRFVSAVLAITLAGGAVVVLSPLGLATWERILEFALRVVDPVTLLQEGEADYERAITYLEGWNAFLSRPLTGIGYWNLPAWLEARYGWGTSSHNILVTLLGEAGLPAAAAFTYLLIQFAARIRMGLRIDLRTPGNAFCAAVAVAMLGALLMSFFHQLLDFQVFYMLLGLACGLPIVPRGFALVGAMRPATKVDRRDNSYAVVKLRLRGVPRPNR